MIFLDATYKGVTQYGFAFYAVLVKNSEGQGIPVSFFILSEESSDILKVCLQKLHEAADCLTPRCVMVDRDMKEIKAIKAVFPNTSVLLCWFHVLQAVHRWLMRQEGGNLRDPSLRNTVIRGMVSLKQCNTEMEFQEHSVKILSDIERETKSARVSDYLKEHWLNIGVMWSNFGRQVFHHHSETNNVVERFFFGMKYNFLAGYANKRVDDLLLVLSSHVVKYYSHLDALKAAGRLRPKTSDALLGVERMKSRGLDHSVSWQCEGKCNVPSETVPGRMYLVDLVYTTCTCEYANLGNMCKHVLLAKCVSASSDIDVNGLRQTKADILYSRNEYVLDKLTVVVHSNGHIGIVNMKNMQCSCLSNSHGEVCVCLTLAQKLVGNTDLEEVGMCVTDSGPTDSEEPLTKWCIKDMVSDLNSWCNSTDYKTSLEVYSGVKHVHKLVFGRYTAVTRKRKIERLHSYRRRVELAKKHLHDMHNYSFSKRGKRQNQTQHSDGKFKRKRSNRKTRVR
ncbi:hypothetical protein AMEX_G2612 [Astyanax mexicanus]|uniref:SWIM-type domain-containing protein n=1 Tax=Astyanax mexicanus TaxID=7994 RepID=A0A8T2MKW8_ASTMX|nr:hypothetical protein AMEX_G2612 [Astyanax mexicanus]